MPPSLPSGVPAAGGASTASSEPGSLPRRFVLFFEDSTSSPQGLTAARKAAQRFLDGSLLPGDQVALASFDRKLHLLHDFTTDRAALRQTIESDLGNLQRFSDYTSEQGQWERDIAELLSPSRVNAASSAHVYVVSTNYAEEFTPRSRDVLRALGTLVDSLAPYPGYKAIVFMGDGVPENPAVDFLQRFGPAAPTSSFLEKARKYDLSQEIQMLARAASAAGVTLHSLQTNGLAATTGAEMRAAGRRSNALETLALNTGGTKSTSNDLVKGLADADNAGRAYYVIGYSPDDPPDGQYHTVQVRVKHANGTVRWRRGFTRLLPEQARQRAVVAAYLLPDLFPDLGVEISAISGPAGGTARVCDLVIHVPPGRAVFVPQPGGAAASLEAGFVVMDGAQHETMRAAREARITLTDGSSVGRIGVDFYSRIRLPLDAQTITAVVSDRTGGTYGAARLRVPPVAASGAPGTFGLSIYSMTEKSLWVEIPPTPMPAPAGETGADYTVGPALKTTFTVGEPLACGFRAEGTVGPAGLRLVIREGGRDVRAIDMTRAIASEGGGRGPGQGSFKVNLPVEGLPAGDYLLVVRRKDATGSEVDAGSAPLILRAPQEGLEKEGAAGR